LLLCLPGFATHTALVFGIDLVLSATPGLFASLAMSVFGLVLVERLFRNVSPDFRWSIKPLCLGLGGLPVRPVPLLRRLLFNRVDPTPSAFAVSRMRWVCRWWPCRQSAAMTGSAGW
jgi:hypothetical protein